MDNHQFCIRDRKHLDINEREVESHARTHTGNWCCCASVEPLMRIIIETQKGEGMLGCVRMEGRQEWEMDGGPTGEKSIVQPDSSSHFHHRRGETPHTLPRVLPQSHFLLTLLLSQSTN